MAPAPTSAPIASGILAGMSALWMLLSYQSLYRFVRASRRHAASIRRAEAGTRLWKEAVAKYEIENAASREELLALAKKVDEKVIEYNKLVGLPAPKLDTKAN